MKTRNILLFGFSLLVCSTLLHAQGVDERGILAAASELDHAIDAKNWKRARALLLKEVTLVMPGAKPETLSADELIKRWKADLHADKSSFHLRGSEVVTFDGADSAVLRSKAQAWFQVEGIAGDDVYEFWADYVHELDRGEDGWRIRRIGYIPRLERGNLAVRDHRMPTPKAQDGDAAEAVEAGANKSSEAGGKLPGEVAIDEEAGRADNKGDAETGAKPAAGSEEATTDKATADDASPDSDEKSDTK